MSTSRKKGGEVNEQLVVIETAALKERLNRIYQTRSTKVESKSFEHLWDLKELALLEGKPSIEVPRPWLEELDCVIEANRTR